MDISVSDNGQLRQLITDLGKAASGMERDVDKVVEKGALNVKNDLAEQARGSAHFRSMARTISYDRATSRGLIKYEVGPDRERGGGAGLAGFFYGWPNGGGGTGDLDGPLRAEEPRMGKALGDLLGGVL